MADRIAVMRDGLIEQCASPHDIFARPANLFVADFLGDSNLLTATVAQVCGDEFAVEIGNGEKMRVARGSSAAAPGSKSLSGIPPRGSMIARLR